MNITINIDDKELQRKVSEGVEALSAEDIAGICRDAVVKAVSDEKFIKGVIASYHEPYGGNSWWEIHPKVLEVLWKAIDPGMASGFAEKLKKVVEEDCRSLVVDALAEAFVNQLYTVSERDCLFQQIFKHMSGQNR